MAETIVSVVLKTKGQEKLEQLKRGIDGTSKKLDQLKGKLGRGIQNQFKSIGRAGIEAGNKIKRGFEVAGNAANGFAKRVGGLRSQLLGLGVGAGLAKSFGDASALESTEARAGLLVKRFEQLDGIQKVAAQSAEKFRLTQTNTLTDLVDLGSRLGATGTSLEDIQTIYEGFNTLLAVNKVESAQAASAQLQLNQALGAGVLNGEEFNAINDATPQLLDAVAKKLNVQRGELKKLASEGKITREVLIAAFADINENAGGDLEGTFTGAFGATREFNAALQEFSTIVGQELLPVITPLIEGATQLLKAFGELPGPVKTAAVGITAIGTAAIFAAPAIAALAKGAIGLLAALGTAKLGAAAAGVAKLSLAFTGLKAAVAFLTGPVGLLIAGVVGVGAAAITATNKINNFNNEINKTTTTSAETANQIQLVEGRLQKLQGELAGSGNSARGLRRQVEELKARLKELKGTYKVQIEIETLFTGQGAIFDGIKSSGFGKGDNGLTYSVAGVTYDAKTGRPVAPPKPIEIPKPIVPGGGRGRGGGSSRSGGAAARESQVPELTRQLSLSDKLLDNRQKLLQAQFDGNRMAIMTAEINRINIELDGKIADINAEKIPDAEKSLRTQLAENEAIEQRIQLENQFAIEERDRKNSIDSILQAGKDELALLQARLDGNEKEIRDRIEIRDLAKQLTEFGFDPAKAQEQAQAFVAQKTALEGQLEVAQQLDSLYKGIGNTIENGIIGAIDAGIDSLLNGTKDLGEALQEIASGVLKDIARQLISFGVKGLLNSTNLPFFAEGGRPEVGKPAIVGEKGPELFIPDTAGTVVPNDEAFNDARSALVSTSGRPATADEEAEAFAVAASALARNSQTINNRNEQQTQSIFNETMMNAASGGMQVNYNGPKLTFNEADYVPAAAVPEIVTSAVKQSTAKVFADMKNRPSVRRSLGMA